MISCCAVSAPEPAVNPTCAVFPPTVPGLFTVHEVANVSAGGVASVIVMVNVPFGQSDYFRRPFRSNGSPAGQKEEILRKVAPTSIAWQQSSPQEGRNGYRTTAGRVRPRKFPWAGSN
jgi:hypothetical protein